MYEATTSFISKGMCLSRVLTGPLCQYRLSQLVSVLLKLVVVGYSIRWTDPNGLDMLGRESLIETAQSQCFLVWSLIQRASTS
jgi:hypothetical protein